VSDPANKEEYEKRYHANQRIEGFGLGNVHIHLPCPFCAAPDFMIYELMETEACLEKGAVCKECKRGMGAMVTRDGGAVQIEMVQTEGPDAPDYVPRMKRIE
jgi:hypothetical protein